MTHSRFGHLTPENLSLFTDLYELRMMQGYHNQDHNPDATFSLFFRRRPSNREYVLTAGLEQAIHAIENISFGERAIDFLNEQGFADEFLSYLATLSFTGDVRVLPEGTVQPTMKLSAGKVTYPGAKSVCRREEDGKYTGDTVGLRDEELPGEKQLVTVIEDGTRVRDLPDLETVRETAREHRRKLSPAVRNLDDPDSYDVRISDGLQAKTDELRATLERRFDA